MAFIHYALCPFPASFFLGGLLVFFLIPAAKKEKRKDTKGNFFSTVTDRLFCSLIFETAALVTSRGHHSSIYTDVREGSLEPSTSAPAVTFASEQSLGGTLITFVLDTHFSVTIFVFRIVCVECNSIYILDAGRCLHSILWLVQLETTGFHRLVTKAESRQDVITEFQKNCTQKVRNTFKRDNKQPATKKR